jgi:DNA-binding transcriptional LysR family regulator
MGIDLNLLRCFQVVANNKSVSRASSILHLSQPAISLQIKRLEDQVGKKLFDRHNRGLTLTVFGRHFLDKAQHLLEVQSDLLSLIEHSEGSPSGRLRVGTYTTASSYLLAAPATRFLSENKNVSLSYDYAESKVLLEKIKDYRIDCAIITDAPQDKLLTSQVFFEDELIFAISKKHKEYKATQINPKDLTRFDFLSYPLRYDLCYKKIEEKFGTYLSKCHIPLETESFDTLKQMLLAGAGATFIPKYLIARELENGSLTEITLGQTKLPISFSFITKKGADLSAATKKFREKIFDSFA